ncbi:MAG: hypothetical protein JXE06_07480 [Coriobacteriia bacterium]|nr:hypothetical protein [Coriobacteriia bacterium]MBN2822350.1 hypothetical protein [Coriobacteriia bacterium]
MKTVHLRVEELHDESEAPTVEAVARYAAGVKDVASVRSMNLISVLYDEAMTDLALLLRAFQRAGFHFTVLAGMS